MKREVSNTYWVKIYISGPVQVIEQVCRQECFETGLCVTIEPTKFVYTGGEETGAIVGLINYPRFPAQSQNIRERAESLALSLLDATFQHSVLVMTPYESIRFSKREEE